MHTTYKTRCGTTKLLVGTRAQEICQWGTRLQTRSPHSSGGPLTKSGIDISISSGSLHIIIVCWFIARERSLHSLDTLLKLHCFHKHAYQAAPPLTIVKITACPIWHGCMLILKCCHHTGLPTMALSAASR